jgi:flagellin
MVTSVNGGALAALLAQEQALARRAPAADAQAPAPALGDQTDPAVVYDGATGPALSAILATSDSLNRAASISDVGVSAGKAIADLVDVLKEKAGEAQSAASPDDQQALDADYQTVLQTIDRIARSASFQGVTMLDGGSGQDLSFKADLSGETSLNLAAQDLTVGGPVLGLAGTDLLGGPGRLAAVLDQVNAASGALSDSLGQMTAQSDQIQGHLGVLGRLQSALADDGISGDAAETARLQALAVQQALAAQGGSVANQAPQALLSLFRA